jgi:putative PIN family toxin of toxin-antitoxin system
VPGPRAILDNNLTFSWLLTAGPTISRVMAAWRAQRFIYVTSPPIFAELRRVTMALAARRTLAADHVAHLKQVEERAEMTAGEVLVAGICRDPDDDMFLSCALESGADYIVTGDRDLLDMRTFRGTRIVTPTQFLLLLEEA